SPGPRRRRPPSRRATPPARPEAARGLIAQEGKCAMLSRSIRLRSSVVVCGAFAAVLAAASAAHAADAKETERQAREHYRKGEGAFAAGRFDEAYKEFESGYALAPRPVFILNMAHAERRRGELRNARALYKKFLVVDPQSKYRPEVEQVLQELDSALAAEEAA